MVMDILVAYPLSKSELKFPARKYYVAFMLCVMLFSGGMMPTYFIVAKTGLIDTIWSLILPGAVPIFNCIVLMNFFRGIPEELEESATLDGANPLQVLIRISLPISKPSIATATLFSLITHWNSWFDVYIYNPSGRFDTLQMYLRKILLDSEAASKLMNDQKKYEAMKNLTTSSVRAATTMIVTIPIVCVYPFFQKYFVSGITIGAVKG